MNKRSMRGLLALNVALLACLALVTASSRVTAQQPAARAPGDYKVISGEVLGQTAHAVYLVDATNQEVVAVYWDQSRRRLAPIGYRDLAADALQAGRPGR
jgi:hypothetical protein